MGGFARYGTFVPFTFFAHQAPLLPIARKWPGAVDGLALAIGTMSPDFAYVLTGTRFHVWAHNWPGIVWFCIPVSLAVCWLIAHVLAPVLPDHLPDLGPFHVRDYRGIATHRIRIVRSSGWALFGAITHALIDQCTHGYGFIASHASWYVHPLGHWLVFGQPWTPFRVVQWIGHVGFTIWSIWLLGKYGTQRWLLHRANQVARFRSTRASRRVLWSTTAVATIIVLTMIMGDHIGPSTAIIRASFSLFVGLCFGALTVQRWETRQRTYPGSQE
jgi:Domain of unknown function (DUF4184)